MRAQRGFSLIEVLAAIAILAIVILMSLAAFLERNKRLQQASELIRAYQSLANEAEIQRKINYLELHSSMKFLSNTEVLEPLESHETAVDVVVTSPGLKSVTLIVRWQNGEREAKLGLLRADTGGTNLW